MAKKKNQDQIPISIELPLGGLNVSSAVGAQPPGTSPDLLNVRLKNTVDRRITLGQRDGTSAHSDRALGNGTMIQGIKTVGLPTLYEPVTTPVESLVAFGASGNEWFDATDGSNDYSVTGQGKADATAGGNMLGTKLGDSTTVQCRTTADVLVWEWSAGSASNTWNTSYNAKLDLVVVTVIHLSDDWDESNGDEINIVILEGSSGAVVWHNRFGTTNAFSEAKLDDDGNLYVVRATSTTNWDYTDQTTTGKTIFKVVPDLSVGVRSRSNTAMTTTWTVTDYGMQMGSRGPCFGLSPNQSHFAIQSDDLVRIYDVSDGSLLASVTTGLDSTADFIPRPLDSGDVIWLFSKLEGGAGDSKVMKYSATAGTSATLFTYSGAFDGWVYGMDVDASDNIYICGEDTTSYTGAGTGKNFFKLDSTGSITWSNLEAGGGLYRCKYIAETTPLAKISDRKIEMYAIESNDLYFMDGQVPVLKQSSVSTGPEGYPVRMTVLQQKIYMIDSAGEGSTYYYDPVTDTLTEWTAAVTDGTMPDDGRLMCTYRGRIVISSGEQWYMSAVGDPLNWDYNPTTFLETQAVAGTVAKYQQINDFQKCLAPYSDDMMVIGCDHEIWVVRGDLAAGGSIDNVTYTLGVTGAESWTFDDRGTFYFFGQGQVYVMTGGGEINTISSPALDKEFEGIDLYTHYVRMTWDRRNQIAHLFFSPAAQPATASYHYAYHQPSNTWWKDQFPAKMGPTCAEIYDGDNPDDRLVLLGGYDGYIYKLDPTATDDDGTQISSYATLGVFQPVGMSSNAIMTRLNAIMPPNSEDLDIKVYAADTPNDALNATTPVYTQNISSGRIPPMLQRVGGNSFKIVLACAEESTSDDWAMEQMDVIFEPGGMTRYGRI